MLRPQHGVHVKCFVAVCLPTHVPGIGPLRTEAKPQTVILPRFVVLFLLQSHFLLSLFLLGCVNLPQRCFSISGLLFFCWIRSALSFVFFPSPRGKGSSPVVRACAGRGRGTEQGGFPPRTRRGEGKGGCERKATPLLSVCRARVLASDVVAGGVPSARSGRVVPLFASRCVLVCVRVSPGRSFSLES